MKNSILIVFTVGVAVMIWGHVNGEDYEVEEQGKNGLCRPVKNELNAVQKKLKEISEDITELETKCNPSCSCEEIKNKYPGSRSGFYTIQVKGKLQKVYCNMDTLCGDSNGGWTRLAYLNMADRNQKCPPGFRLYEANGVRACGKQMTGAGCQSIKFPSKGISYTQVCGRVTGYQKGSPDAIHSYKPINSIDQEYVDGVSITRGNPRQHIWTFMAALQENFFLTNGVYVCPCAPNSPVTPQSFIGNDYFCESGNPTDWDRTTLHINDPLWDGKQCGLIEEACCNVTGIPWFNKVLKQPTTDYIELRVCIDQHLYDEVSLVGEYEIYVK